MNLANDKEKPPGNREAKKLRSRKLILAAARRLFREQGYTETRVDEIAEVAGVAVGTCYNYFEHKGDMLLAIVVEADQECIAEGRRILRSLPDDPLEALCEMAFNDTRHSIGALDKTGWRQVLAATLSNPLSTFALAYAGTTDQICLLTIEAVRVLKARGTLRQDVDHASAGRTLHALKYMHFINHISDDNASFADHQANVRASFDFVVRGLANDR